MAVEWTPERIKAAFRAQFVQGDPDYYITGAGRPGGEDDGAWEHFCNTVDNACFDRMAWLYRKTRWQPPGKGE